MQWSLKMEWFWLKNETLCFGYRFCPHGLNYKRWSQELGCNPIISILSSLILSQFHKITPTNPKKSPLRPASIWYRSWISCFSLPQIHFKKNLLFTVTVQCKASRSPQSVSDPFEVNFELCLKCLVRDWASKLLRRVCSQKTTDLTSMSLWLVPV